MAKVGDTFHIGEICPVSGLYRLVNCKGQGVSKEQSAIPLTKGEKFPPCRNCKEEVVWRLIKEAKV